MIDTFRYGNENKKNVLPVTSEDIRIVVEKYLNPEKRVVVTLVRE